MTPVADVVAYWDSSAALSVLFRDPHTEETMVWIRRSGVHLLSTLAWAEVHAVIARIQRERVFPKALLDGAREALRSGPWRRTNASPGWSEVQALAVRWPLRGADLWHLATVKSLRSELPELTLVSLDTRLTSAARAAGLA